MEVLNNTAIPCYLDFTLRYSEGKKAKPIQCLIGMY